MTKSIWRISAAFLLAPVVPCTLLVLLTAAEAGQWNGALFIAASVIVVSIALGLVICLPAYLLLQRFWKVRLIECIAAGICTAILLNIAIYVVAALYLPESDSAADSGGPTRIDGKLTDHGRVVALWGVAWNMLLGASIGFCFWAIALWRGPSEQPAKPVVETKPRDELNADALLIVREPTLCECCSTDTLGPMDLVGPDVHRESECEAVLRTLPKRFGIEPALLMYARDSGTKPTFALVEQSVVGFITLQEHFTSAWEVHCVAIRAEARGQGHGSRLLSHAEAWLIAKGVRYLQVKTVAASSASLAYARTREFYARRGFDPLQVFPTLWDAHNPALQCIKVLRGA